MTGNLLHLETSPYLLQHKDNPVHWMGWSDAAFAKAVVEHRPVLLSVGYAACHWCHVMAHESFEDTATAKLMNANFINIKVDREERPDVDRIYMSALHVLGEQGGWPLTMFLTPEGKPFWGGTYFPPESRYGRPGFKQVLSELARIWRQEPEKIVSSATALTLALETESRNSGPHEIRSSHVEAAAAAITRAIDPVMGGLKGAPKFPQAPIFSFLWTARYKSPEAFSATVNSLRQMSQGGIYDHLAGGLARYSVDANWLVPHFEKMLSDNAQYVALLTRVWLETQDALFLIRIEETVGFVLREMLTPEGAFATSYDADSEGEEGRYYVWTKDEIERVLPRGSSALFERHYAVTATGNWEGHTILNRSASTELADPSVERQLAQARRLLLAARRKRVPPAFDDKVLVDWNGLMITALAEAALVFSRDDWRTAAVRAMDATMRLLWRDKRLLHAYRAGQARHEATADGYANLITAARALHMLTGETRYLQTAENLAQALLKHFWDQTRGGLYFSSDRADALIVRTRSIADDATPNANGTMIANFAALYHLTGNTDYLTRAETIVSSFSEDILANPFAAPTALKSWLALSDAIQIVTTGPKAIGLFRQTLSSTGLDVVYQNAAAGVEISPHHPAYEKAAGLPQDRLYICRGNTCASPAHDLQGVDEALSVLALPKRIYAFIES